MKKISFLLVALVMSVVGISQNHWVPNMYQFPSNMNVIAIIEVNDMEQQSGYLELGVFCGEECRGSSMLKYYDAPISRYMIFLTACGDNGDPFSFRLYDHLTEQELDLVSENEMSFLSNDIIGELFEPYVFAFSGGDCAVAVSAVPSLAGEVTGGGVVPCGTYCTVDASPFEYSEFVAWMLNGDTLTTEPQCSFNAVADIDLEAHFSLREYAITLVAMPDHAGTVEGSGDYVYGEQCEAKATPFDDYEFVGWTENGELVSTSANYSFVVDRNHDLVANLVHVSDVDENRDGRMISPNPTTGKVWIVMGDGAVADDVAFVVCDLNGRVLFTTTENPIDISRLDDGVYLVCVGGGKLHKLILQR